MNIYKIDIGSNLLLLIVFILLVILIIIILKDFFAYKLKYFEDKISEHDKKIIALETKVKREGK